MSKSYEVTPMELYFCAKLMKARYLDYDYVRAMPDVQKQYLLHEQETMEALEEKGMAEVDFDGNAAFEEELQELLEPIFFGEKESRVDIDGQPSRRFHIGREKIVMTVLDDGVISLAEVTDGEMRDLLKADKVEIYLSDVHVGKKTGVFTSADLENENNRETVIKLLKGEK